MKVWEVYCEFRKKIISLEEPYIYQFLEIRYNS